jgi:transcriptional regulator with XRE-family HTH domain
MSDFGDYLRSLREQQRLSLRDVAAKTGVSISYITMIEHSKRKPPGPEVLKKLALSYKEVKSVLSIETEVEMAFNYVMSDPRYHSGTRLSGPMTTDVKRFVVEMYEKATGKKLLSGE